jgi:molybdopterin-guanine dinucleotide biosynthesis protein B
MIVVAVVGTSNSGKTTTIEYLVERISKEGYKVGSIKHIHHENFSIDTKGTDTWRHAQAGAIVTVAVSPKEMAIIKKAEAPLNDLDQILGLLNKENLDFVFIEGLHSLCTKRKDIFKIITAKDPEDLLRTLTGTEQPILAITGVIAKKKPEMSEIKIPIIDLNSEGDSLLKIVKSQIGFGKTGK